MAKRGSPGGSGGGTDESKKQSFLLGSLAEIAEVAAGMVTANAFHNVMRAGASGALASLKGKFFEKLFPTKRPEDKTAKATAGDIEDALKGVKSNVMAASGDAKLGQLAQDYMSSVIAIQSSGRNEADKAKAIEEAKSKLKASVNEHLLAKSKQSLQNLMAELSDVDNDDSAVAKKKFKETTDPERPNTYREDFFKWLQQELTPAQRQLVMARRSKISSIRVITDMLDYSGNSQDRLSYFQFALGQPEVKELAGEIAQAAVTGTLSEHPFIQGLAKSSQHGANVRTVQRRVTAARRSRLNKL